MVNTSVAVFFEQMDDSFGIALCAIAVASSLKIAAQLPVIVDFTVEDDPEIPSSLEIG